MKNIILLFVLILFTLGVNAQDIKGDWKMYKNVDKPSADSEEEFGETQTAEEIGANKWISFTKEKMILKYQIEGGEIGEGDFDYIIEDDKIVMKRGEKSKEYGTIVSVDKNELVIYTKMDGWDYYKRLSK